MDKNTFWPWEGGRREKKNEQKVRRRKRSGRLNIAWRPDEIRKENTLSDFVITIIIAKLGLLAYPRCCILQDDLKEKQGNSRNGSAEQQDSCSQQYFAGIGWCKNDLHIGRACVTHWTHKKRSLNIFILIMTLTRTFMVL